MLKSLFFIISDIISIPLRIYLSLFNLSTNELIIKRNSSTLYFSKITYNSFLNRFVSIPFTVKIGLNINFVHNAVGTVIHPKTVIGNNVKIYQNVTIGRGNIWEEDDDSFEGFEIKDNVVLCAGAKIISSRGKLIIGEGTIIGANAVLTHSTGDKEIWAGIPARKIGVRSNCYQTDIIS